MTNQQTPMHPFARLNEEAGYHWFKPDTRRFFGSRYSSHGYGSATDDDTVYFVSSEYTGFDRRGRAYSVRKISRSTGKVDTVGKFGGYATRDAAHRAANRLAQG